MKDYVHKDNSSIYFHLLHYFLLDKSEQKLATFPSDQHFDSDEMSLSDMSLLLVQQNGLGCAYEHRDCSKLCFKIPYSHVQCRLTEQ